MPLEVAGVPVPVRDSARDVRSYSSRLHCKRKHARLPLCVTNVAEPAIRTAAMSVTALCPVQFGSSDLTTDRRSTSSLNAIHASREPAEKRSSCHRAPGAAAYVIPGTSQASTIAEISGAFTGSDPRILYRGQTVLLLSPVFLLLAPAPYRNPCTQVSFAFASDYVNVFPPRNSPLWNTVTLVVDRSGGWAATGIL